MPKPFAFVLMPFDDAFADVYKLGIQATAKEHGVVAERVDEQVFSESMLDRIYRQIDAADLIIADMTGKNPNVFYEVGYAHARGKLVTLLTQNTADIPFDLRHHRHLVYGASIQTLKSKLGAELQWLLGELERRKTSVLDVSLSKHYEILIKSDYTAHADVDLVFDLHNRTDRRTPEIEALYLHTGNGWDFSDKDGPCPSTQSEHKDYATRHLLKPPLTRFSPGGWAQLKASGRKTLWTKWDGSELQTEYRLVGHVTLEVVTAEGSYFEHINIDLRVDEFPF